MIFSTTYFGNLAYWQTVMSANNVITVEAFENFQKQTFRNRCQIVSANGLQNLTVPVIRTKGSKTPINEIEISYAENWQKDHWKAIESAYKHAPYFWYYGESVKTLIYQTPRTLLEYNTSIFNQISEWLSLKSKIIYSTEFTSIDVNLDLKVKLNRKDLDIKITPYIQVFSDKLPFINNPCIIDSLFNIGPITVKLIS